MRVNDSKAASFAKPLTIIAMGLLLMAADPWRVRNALAHHGSGIGMQRINYAFAPCGQQQYKLERVEDMVCVGWALV